MNPQQDQNPTTPPPVPTPEPIIVPPQLVQPGQTTQPSAPQQPMAQPVPPPSSKKGLIIGIVVVAVILIVGGVAFALLGKKSSSTVTATSPSSKSTSSSSSVTTSKTACQLFTLSDAQSTIGSDASQMPPQPAQSKNNNTQSLCIYSSGSNSLTIVAMVAMNSAGSSYQESTFSKALSASGVASVSGLGDKAVYGQPSYGGEQIEVIKGKVLFTILVNHGDQSTLTSMAQTVLNNL